MKSVALFVAVALAAITLAQQKSTAQKMVEKQVAALSKATENKDLKAISAILAPDYQSKTQGRVVKREDLIKQLQQLFKVAQHLKIDGKVASFKLEKGVGNAVTHSIVTYEVKGADGKEHTVKQDSTSAQTWVPGNGTYKLKSSSVEKLKVFVDGTELSQGSR